MINAAIPELRKEFLSVHGQSTEGIPLYSEYIGNDLDPKNKWKMIVIKIMGRLERKNLKTYPKLAELVKSIGPTCRSAGYSILEPGAEIPEPPSWLLEIWRKFDSTYKQQLLAACPWAVIEDIYKTEDTHKKNE